VFRFTRTSLPEVSYQQTVFALLLDRTHIVLCAYFRTQYAADIQHTVAFFRTFRWISPAAISEENFENAFNLPRTVSVNKRSRTDLPAQRRSREFKEALAVLVKRKNSRSIIGQLTPPPYPNFVVFGKCLLNWPVIGNSFKTFIMELPSDHHSTSYLSAAGQVVFDMSSQPLGVTKFDGMSSLDAKLLLLC
jgi:hypothetical protein